MWHGNHGRKPFSPLAYHTHKNCQECPVDRTEKAKKLPAKGGQTDTRERYAKYKKIHCLGDCYSSCVDDPFGDAIHQRSAME